MKTLWRYLVGAWKWLGNDTNHNALTILLATVAVILAFPFFSKKIDNIEIRVNSIEQDLRNLFQKYTLETFCYNDLKDSFKTVNGQTVVDIRLKSVPITNSVSLWEGALNVPPNSFKVEGNIIEEETNLNADGLKALCNNGGFNYTVTYVKSD